MRKLGVSVILGLLLAAVTVPAWAAHTDGGVDEPWMAAMNQETYWEARFNMECTKFERHSGFIPAQYDAAVVKDGNWVRVYASVGGAFTASGAVNPANGNHFAAPHSWVMKCYSTTTTTQEETTTTEVEDTTTTEATTTTIGTDSTTTTSSDTTTSSSPATTSTTNPVTSTTPTTSQPLGSSSEAELPFTGPAGVVGLLVAGLTAVGIGSVLVREFRSE